MPVLGVQLQSCYRIWSKRRVKRITLTSHFDALAHPPQTNDTPDDMDVDTAAGLGGAAAAAADGTAAGGAAAAAAGADGVARLAGSAVGGGSGGSEGQPSSGPDGGMAAAVGAADAGQGSGAAAGDGSGGSRAAGGAGSGVSGADEEVEAVVVRSLVGLREAAIAARVSGCSRLVSTVPVP